jgi:hypothetical protein
MLSTSVRHLGAALLRYSFNRRCSDFLRCRSVFFPLLISGSLLPGGIRRRGWVVVMTNGDDAGQFAFRDRAHRGA